MAVSAGDAYLDVHARLAGDTGRKLTGQLQGPMGRAGEEAGRHFGKKFAVGLAIGAAAIGVGLLRATQAAARGIQATTDKASDLNETINKTNVIFGRNAAEVQKWSRGSARNLGLSRQEALSSAAAFGDMFLQLKLGQPQAVRMSKGMVTLASDLASFSNADITQVLEAQQSAFRGEYDALQRFIPNINAARVEQEALRETHKKSAKDLTAAEKAQAVYNIMLKDSARAQGDFQRTSRQLANTRRIEKAQWEDLQAAIGKRFLPAQLAVHRALSEKVLPALGVLVRTYGPAVERTATRWATSFANVIPSTRDLQLGLRALGLAFAGEGITTSSDKFVGKMERIGVAARKVVDWFKTLRPQFSSVGRSASEVGPALASAGGGGHVFANALTVVAPVLDVVARNIHNILPWLPALVAGFLAFRAVRSVIAPIRDVGETIAHFTSPATAAATYMNARANKALAAALTERSVAEAAAGRAAAADAVATTTAGNAAQAASSRWAGLATQLGLAVVAYGLAANANSLLNKAQEYGHSIHARFVAPMYERLGIYSHGRVQQLRDEEAAEHASSEAKRQAALAGYRHADALRAEKQATDALKDALRGEESAELDVRQAKLNVSSAQRRLTELTKSGKKGSAEYKQAQIDLRRAQIDLKDRTADYKTAQLRANAATSGAMHASQQAQPPLKKLGDTAKTGGDKAKDARIPWAKLGERVARTYGEIHSKTANITANFGWQGLQVFRTGGGALGGGNKAFARGGRLINGFAGGPTSDSNLIRVSKGETVVPTHDSNDPGFQSWAASRGIPGFAAGGRIPRFSMRGDRGFTNALGDWDLHVGKVLDLAASRFKKLAAKSLGSLGGGSGPGGWRWQMAVLRSAFPGLSLISGFRPGAITSTGNRSYHAMGRAVDVPPRWDVFNWISAMFGKRTKELIFTPAGARQIKNGQHHVFTGGTIRQDHYNHVHWAYDKGGMLPPGRTLAVNNTGRSELVLPAQLLGSSFRKSLQSWVVPWLKRIAVAVEGGRAGRAGGGGGGGAPKKAAPWWAKYGASVDYGTVSQGTWDALYVAGWRGRPGDHAERFYRPASFDQGGWLQPGMVGVNTGTKAERVVGPHEQLIDERGLARMVGRAVAQSLRDNPPAVYLDRQKVSRGVADGALWERRR